MKRLLVLLFAVLVFWLPSHVALAAGTPAGTNITNQATATYTAGTTSFIENSNIVTTTVDELLDVTVTWQDAANITVNPGDTNRVLTFLVTNTGNGTDDYTLAGLSTLVGDNFDPTLVALHFDINGNGVYDPGTDVQYTPGLNDPTLAADASVTVFVLNDIPGVGLSDGDLGNSQLTATSNTGSGAAGTVVAGAGDGGTDAVVGSSGGSADGIGTYVASTVVVSVVKSAVIADPFGGAEPVPGAVISYSIAVTVSVSGPALSVVITDLIPADTTYNTGTLTLNAAPLTDAADADAGDVGGTTPGTVTVNLGDLPVGSLETVAFEVTIN